MNRTMYLKAFALYIAIAMSACSPGEDSESVAVSDAWTPVNLDMEQGKHVIARHRTADDDVTVSFFDLDGSLAVDFEYSVDSDQEVVEAHRSLIADASAGDMSYDQLYERLAGTSADEQVVDRLRYIQTNMRKVFESGVKAARPSDHQIEDITQKLERYLQVEERPVSASKSKASCAKGTTESWFNVQACGIASLSNSTLPWTSRASGHKVILCKIADGSSSSGTSYADYYRFWSANPYKSGGPSVKAGYVFGVNGYYSTLAPGKIKETSFYNPDWKAIRSNVYSTSSTCDDVCHAIITVNIDFY